MVKIKLKYFYIWMLLYIRVVWDNTICWGLLRIPSHSFNLLSWGWYRLFMNQHYLWWSVIPSNKELGQIKIPHLLMLHSVSVFKKMAILIQFICIKLYRRLPLGQKFLPFSNIIYTFITQEKFYYDVCVWNTAWNDP